MTAPKDESKKLKHVLEALSSLRGVRIAFYLKREERKELERIERMPRMGPLAVENQGVFECLKRKHLVCIVKDKTFRPPPCPTVLLIDDDGNTIGKEILPGEKVKAAPGQRLLHVGRDFVVFYDGRRAANARFVLPPIPFKELDDMEGVSKAASSSPSTHGDLFIKKSKGLDDDPKLATILIGFDLR
jgi:hypothetical protein